jgi:large subunit ribosomal protein L13e
VEGKTVNVERLKAYKARLIVFPRKTGKPKKGDSAVRSLDSRATQADHLFQADDLKVDTTRITLPLPEAYPAEAPRKITTEEREFNAFRTLRIARANQRHEGVRKARAAKVGNACMFCVFTHFTMTCTERRRRSSQEEVIFFYHYFCCFTPSWSHTFGLYPHKNWARRASSWLLHALYALCKQYDRALSSG